MVVGAQQQTVEVSADVLFFHSDSNALGSTFCFFFSSRRRHTRWNCEWSSDVCSSDLLDHGVVGLGAGVGEEHLGHRHRRQDRKSTRLNSSHSSISYAVFCLKKKKK